MSRLDRYLLREIAWPFALSVAGTVALIFLFQARRLAAAALGLGLAPADAGLIFVSALPPFLVLALPIAYLLSVLVGLGRLQSELELVAMRAAGASPLRIARVPVGLGLVVSLVGLPIAIYGEPYGLRLLHARLTDVGLRNLTQAIRPGVFNEDFRGSAVYAAARDDAGALRDVLVFDDRQAQPVLITAAAGRFELTEGGGVTFSLEGGELHLAEPEGTDRYDRLRFDRASLGLDAEAEIHKRTRFIGLPGQMTNAELLEDAALHPDPAAGRRLERSYWRRFSFPSMALVFGIFGAAIALSGGPRSRSRSALLGIAAVLGYYLSTRFGDQLINQYAGTALLGVWLPNLLAAGLGLGWLARAGRPA